MQIIMKPCVIILFISILLGANASEVSHKKRLETNPSCSRNKKLKNYESSVGKNEIPVDDERKVYIAVIGGGINSALFTHYVHELIKAKVHIYNHGMIEKTENSSFIVHESQKYMMEMISKFNFETKDLHPTDRAVVMYDGYENPVLNFEQNNPIKIFMASYIKQMLQKFEKIYDIQQIQLRSFTTLSTLLHKMSETFERLLTISTQELIEENRYFRNISNIKEIIHSLLLINYGQNLESHAFAGLTSLIFSQSTGKLKRITTPVDQVIRKLLGKSDRFFNVNVSKVTYEVNAHKLFRPRLTWNDQEGKECSRLYDYVVIATPEIDNINFSKYKNPIAVCQNRKMVFATVKASLKDDISENLNLAMAIANVKDDPGLIRLANKISNSWKILADDDAGVSTEISSIFNVTGNAVFEKIALWPDYSNKECAVKATFDLDMKLFNLNAIEWGSSLLEMKAIGAKNVALRIKKVKEQKMLISCNPVLEKIE